jgi:hypothetical protein
MVKFVTPGPVKPIADLLWTVYNDTEDYVNGVLMIMHQITYIVSPPMYPVEYFANNSGDCEVSYLTASLTIAGGLKTVLFLWDISGTGHVNVGVALDHPPQEIRTSDYYYVTVNGLKYYIAESTGDKWETGWRVGEYPNELVGLTPIVITLENVDWSTPAGLISASFSTSTLQSSITLTKTFPLLCYYQTSGVLSPAISNQTINLYIITSNSYKLLAFTTTDVNGSFTLKYLPLMPTDITYGNLVVVWNGNEQYQATSAKLSLLGLDTFVYMPFWLVLGFILAFVGFAKKVH